MGRTLIYTGTRPLGMLKCHEGLKCPLPPPALCTAAPSPISPCPAMHCAAVCFLLLNMPWLGAGGDEESSSHPAQPSTLTKKKTQKNDITKESPLRSPNPRLETNHPITNQRRRKPLGRALRAAAASQHCRVPIANGSRPGLPPLCVRVRLSVPMAVSPSALREQTQAGTSVILSK